MMHVYIDQREARRREIDNLDAVSRTRALTETESRRLESLLNRERYAGHSARRRKGKAA